ncbi:hypothetical protein HDC90_001760 [Pedobacter sp. AK013]|nr:hypothetical protein [Pedobacter sp. AK013]
MVFVDADLSILLHFSRDDDNIELTNKQFANHQLTGLNT